MVVVVVVKLCTLTFVKAGQAWERVRNFVTGTGIDYRVDEDKFAPK